MNQPKVPVTTFEILDLQRRFKVVAQYMTEDNEKVPTSKEVWEEMKRVALRNKEECEMMDVGTEHYQRQIMLIETAISNLPK